MQFEAVPSLWIMFGSSNVGQSSPSNHHNLTSHPNSNGRQASPYLPGGYGTYPAGAGGAGGGTGAGGASGQHHASGPAAAAAAAAAAGYSPQDYGGMYSMDPAMAWHAAAYSAAGHLYSRGYDAALESVWSAPHAAAAAQMHGNLNGMAGQQDGGGLGGVPADPASSFSQYQSVMCNNDNRDSGGGGGGGGGESVSPPPSDFKPSIGKISSGVAASGPSAHVSGQTHSSPDSGLAVSDSGSGSPNLQAPGYLGGPNAGGGHGVVGAAAAAAASASLGGSRVGGGGSGGHDLGSSGNSAGGGAGGPASPPSSASVRPQPVRSPYEWMKRPSFQSKPAAKEGNVVGGKFIFYTLLLRRNPYKSSWNFEFDVLSIDFAGRTRTKDKYRVVYSDHQRLEIL